MSFSAGLTKREASARLDKYGRNEIKPHQRSWLLVVWRWLVSPITLMLLAAAGLSLYSHELFDCYFILALATLNTLITASQHHRANKAVGQLQRKLMVEARVRRDSVWQNIDAGLLVPGDFVSLGVGDVVPADLVLKEIHNLDLNESTLTGESLPQSKTIGDTAFAGSFVATGSARGEVTVTGAATAYGKTLVSIESSTKRSLLEREILSITYMLSIISVLITVLITVLLVSERLPITGILRLDLSLLIAGVPVSLPTVTTIIIGLGVLGLAKKQVIVRRLGALENLANINLLLTDKTGTLTQNLISIEQIITFNDFAEIEIAGLAQATVDASANVGPIDQAIVRYCQKLGLKPLGEATELTPADSERKRATVKLRWRGHQNLVSVGAPQVVIRHCRVTEIQKARFEQAVNTAAAGGFRTLAVAVGQGATHEQGLKLAGLILLSDTPQADAADVIKSLGREGIVTKMVTGDSLPISQRVATTLGLKGQMLSRSQLSKLSLGRLTKEWWEKQAGFAEILPEDKFNLTESAKRFYVAGVTGDGVNDLPAVAAADVGIAVKNAVDALKQTADIVILAEGISVIKDALTEARKIFERLYSYSVYRISESLRLILTIAFLGFTIHSYPLTPIQLILIAFFNDLPIISLAYNRVKVSHVPSRSQSRRRLYRGLLHGSIGVINSLSLYFLLANVMHLPLSTIQTAYFLKLTVSGHMLIYVAHTDERWYKFLPSLPVVLATSVTQIIASLIAGVGFLMAPISAGLIGLVWVWSFGWMQVSDLAKAFVPKK